ncbi:MAG: TolC family protein [Gammaproteobacteria bacterium]|nr:TolC family protein [Gammaproteobacteria bacterium]
MPPFPVHARARHARVRLWWTGALLSVGLYAPVCVAAAGVDLTLRQAIEAAIAHNPDLAVFEFDFRANDAQRRQAALRPPIDAGVSLEGFAGTGPLQGLGGSEATLSISRIIELGGKRRARIAAVAAGRDALSSARQVAQLDVVAEVTRRFIAVAEAQEKVALARRVTELAADTARASDVRVQAARAPHVELDRAAVAEQRARVELQSAASQLEAARHSLAAMWGSDEASLNGRPLGSVHADLYRLPGAGDFAALIARLAQNPDFLRLATEERLRDAELRLAASQRRADLTLGGGLRRLQDGRDYGLVASFSIPLFAGRRAEGAIAEASARRDAVGAEREAAVVRARARLFALHRQLQDAVAVAQSLESTTIPTMEEALRETEYAFERGRYSYLELVDAQREYLALQSQRIDASTLAQLLAAEIERLTSAPLTP